MFLIGRQALRAEIVKSFYENNNNNNKKKRFELFPLVTNIKSFLSVELS